MTEGTTGAASPAPPPTAWRFDGVLRDVAAGLLVGTLMVVISVSLASLVFPAELGGLRASGIGLALLATLLGGAVVAATSSLPSMSGHVQDTPAAILAVMAAAALAASPPQAPPEARFVTVVALIGLTTLATGLAFLAVGHLRLGRVVRYLPYPVVGGFMAGTGWLLLTGGIGVMSDVQPSLTYLSDLVAGDAWRRWLPGLGFAAIAVLVTRRTQHPLAFPGLIAAATAAFYLALAASGATLESWRSAGALLGPFPQEGLVRPIAADELRHVEWRAVASQAGGAAAVVFLAVMAVLFNATGLELGLRRRVDLDRELRAAGLGNLLAGSLGGMVSYQGLSFTMLNHRLGSGGRLAAFVALALVGFVMLQGTAPLELVPTLVLGGILSYLGLAFLIEWVHGAYGRLSRLEYAIVVVILLTIAIVGFLPGVALGLVLAVALFVVSYGRVDAVKHALSGAEAFSRVRRDALSRRALVEHGESTLVLQLHGYLFFGTANGLVERVERRLERGPRLRHLVVDFAQVSGVDATAATSFASLARLGAARGVELLLSQLPPDVARRLRAVGVDVDGPAGPRRVATLDDGLEWCEERVLETSSLDRGGASGPDASLAMLAEEGLDVPRLLEHLERIEVPAGQRLIVQGDAADALYLVASGRVTARLELASGESLRLETMRGGSLVGEIGIYRGDAVRGATVIADEPSTVYRLGRDRLEELSQRDPPLATTFHRFVARRLADRVSHLQRVVEALQR